VSSRRVGPSVRHRPECSSRSCGRIPRGLHRGDLTYRYQTSVGGGVRHVLDQTAGPGGGGRGPGGRSDRSIERGGCRSSSGQSLLLHPASRMYECRTCRISRPTERRLVSWVRPAPRLGSTADRLQLGGRRGRDPAPLRSRPGGRSCHAVRTPTSSDGRAGRSPSSRPHRDGLTATNHTKPQLPPLAWIGEQIPRRGLRAPAGLHAQLQLRRGGRHPSGRSPELGPNLIVSPPRILEDMLSIDHGPRRRGRLDKRKAFAWGQRGYPVPIPPASMPEGMSGLNLQGPACLWDGAAARS